MRHSLRSFVLCWMAAGLCACSADVNPVRDVAVATGIGPQPRTAPDFVAASRPEKLDYIPVGVSAPARPVPAKPQASVGAFEAEMNAVRAANEARAAEARAAGASAPPAAPQ
jgi:hypothetical protein